MRVFLLRACARDRAHVTARAATVQTSARCSLARPGIQEVDLNPVKVYAAGQGALALDALIIMKAPDGRTTS